MPFLIYKYMLRYKEQLQHPLWIQKQNEIILRDNDVCRICKDTSHIHQVHHLCYFPDTHIWEYDNELMITICKKCHYDIQFELPKLAGLLAFRILTSEIDPLNIEWLINFLKDNKGLDLNKAA